MTKQQYNLIENEIGPFVVGSRTASAGQLAWFLQATWRVEPEEIDEAICDGSGDKGIDGLLVDEDLSEITILQSKHYEKHVRTQGDADLKQLVGAGAYFADLSSVEGLINAKPNDELLRLLNRLEIRERVAEGAHVKRLVFVTNAELDAAGQSYLDAVRGQNPLLEVWDRARLSAVAERTRRPALRPETVKLHAISPPTTYTSEGLSLVVAVIAAKELVQLPGIDDLSLFDRNVRLSEGRTRINRELGETIDTEPEHAIFPAYHNGLTLLTKQLTVRGKAVSLNGVTVVNGCQSLLTFHQHRAALSDKLNVLVKVVQVAGHTDLADKITYRSNNQNPVDIRDQRSTDEIQRALQAEVRNEYGDGLAYCIRQGERFKTNNVLDNREAAQFMMAIYSKQPWNAVRKVRLFDEEYRRIFTRAVDAHRLYFVHVFRQVVDAARSRLRPELSASFASTRLTIAHLLAQVLRETPQGTGLIDRPHELLPAQEDAVRKALASLADEVVDSVNFFIQEEEKEKKEAFDAKVVFKSASGVSQVENDVLRSARRAAKRDKKLLFTLEPAAARRSKAIGARKPTASRARRRGKRAGR